MTNKVESLIKELLLEHGVKDSQLKILTQSLPPKGELLYRVKSHIDSAQWAFIGKYVLL